MKSERWRRAYREEPALFDAFARAEDPGGRLAETLAELGLLEDKCVLEIGCGTGRLAERLADLCGRYVALDREAGMLAHASSRLAGHARAGVVRADATELPLAAKSVDVVLAAWVLAHMPEAGARACVAEARRVGREGAAMLLLESAEESEFQSLRGPDRGRLEARLLSRLESCGFRRTRLVKTSIEFPSEEEAARVLGYLCRAEEALARAPRRSFAHDVLVMELALDG